MTINEILRFMLIIIIILILLKVGQQNPYIGFGLYLALVVSFTVYTNSQVEHDDLEFVKEMLKTPEGRRKYYKIINSS